MINDEWWIVWRFIISFLSFTINIKYPLSIELKYVFFLRIYYQNSALKILNYTFWHAVSREILDFQALL